VPGVTADLVTSAVVTLDANGNGTALIGPINARESWQPQVVSVKTNQAPGTVINEAQCRIFCGADTSDPNYVGGTLSGSTGDSTGNISATVYCGQYVFAVWSGGDAGAQGRMNVTGTKQLAGARR
jgi:hypothetical protein